MASAPEECFHDSALLLCARKCAAGECPCSFKDPFHGVRQGHIHRLSASRSTRKCAPGNVLARLKDLHHDLPGHCEDPLSCALGDPFWETVRKCRSRPRNPRSRRHDRRHLTIGREPLISARHFLPRSHSPACPPFRLSSMFLFGRQTF